MAFKLRVMETNPLARTIAITPALSYEKVKKSGVLTKESMAKLYNIKPERISHFVEFDVINAIKFTIYRTSPSGSPGESDVLGCQQYGPLLDIEVPWDIDRK